MKEKQHISHTGLNVQIIGGGRYFIKIQDQEQTGRIGIMYDKVRVIQLHGIKKIGGKLKRQNYHTDLMTS